MATLHTASLQFLQGNAAVQTAQLRANQTSPNLLLFRGQRIGDLLVNYCVPTFFVGTLFAVLAIGYLLGVSVFLE